MKRRLDEDQAPNRDVLGALRDRPIDPGLDARVLQRIQAGGTPRVARHLRPAGVIAAGTTVAAIIAVVALVAMRSHREASPPLPSPLGAPTAARDLSSPYDATTTSDDALPPVVVAPHKAVSTAPHRPKPVTAAATARETKAPAEEESRLLLDAYRALRQQHDDALALLRVDEYLRRFPNGALGEEALVIAFDATRDERARAYARTYLARFPRGPHVERARALAASPE